ncbi:ABC transporter permease, partial [Fusobacterium nucleatum]
IILIVIMILFLVGSNIISKGKNREGGGAIW